MHAAYIVLNESIFLPYSLRSIYDYVDKIHIVEGAVIHASHIATPNGHSLDDTLEVIKNFPDPNGKIKLITKDGFWQDKSDMLDAIVPHVKDHWFFRIDGDEVFRKEDIEKLAEFCRSDKDTFVGYCNFLNFWKNPHTIIRGGFWSRSPHATLFRMDNGLHHVGHHHCFPRDSKDRNLRSFHYYEERRKQLPITIFHYSYLKDERSVGAKVVFFQRRDHKQPLDKAQTKVKEHGWFSGKLGEGHYLEPFNGEHPEVMKDFFK